MKEGSWGGKTKKKREKEREREREGERGREREREIANSIPGFPRILTFFLVCSNNQTKIFGPRNFFYSEK